MEWNQQMVSADDEHAANDDASAFWYLAVIFLVLIHFTGLIRISFIRILIYPILSYVHSSILAFRLNCIRFSYISVPAFGEDYYSAVITHFIISYGLNR